MPDMICADVDRSTARPHELAVDEVFTTCPTTASALECASARRCRRDEDVALLRAPPAPMPATACCSVAGSRSPCPRCLRERRSLPSSSPAAAPNTRSRDELDVRPTVRGVGRVPERDDRVRERPQEDRLTRPWARIPRCRAEEGLDDSAFETGRTVNPAPIRSEAERVDRLPTRVPYRQRAPRLSGWRRSARHRSQARRTRTRSWSSRCRSRQHRCAGSRPGRSRCRNCENYPRAPPARPRRPLRARPAQAGANRL